MSLHKNLHWFLYPIFFLACARQTAPTGGPKDTIPPVLVSSIPVKEQLNYKGKNVELTFSEMIQLNNPKEQIIITPDVGGEYEVAMRKNKVILNFRNELTDSTTYLINFRDAVADITEKNPVSNLKLAFSTGSYIDSLSIQGIVSDLLKAKDTKDATVALYQADTFDIFKHKPVYLTKTNDKGNFIFENLKPGNYFIYALEDKNKNLVVDSKTEGFGFLSNAIALKENQKNIIIPTIRLDMRPLKLNSARPYNTYFNLKTAKNLEMFKFTSQESEIIISAFGDDKANIKVFNTIAKDSALVRFHASDSINNMIDTTLYIKFIKREVTPEKFQVKTSGFKVIENRGLLRGKVNFSKPIININYDSILYKIDSTHSVTFSKQDFTWDSLNNILSIEKKFDKTLLVLQGPEGPDKTPTEQPKPTPVKKSNPKDPKSAPAKVVEHQLYIGKGSFVSIELDTSAQTTETLKPSKLEETGIIFVEVQTKEANFLVELLDKDFKLIQSSANNKKPTFEDLPPAEYQIRLIIDKDNNGKWSPGNYYKKTEPEPVRFYKNEKNLQLVNLKANWEIGPLLITF